VSIIDVKEDWSGLAHNHSNTDVRAVRIYTVKFDSADQPYRRPILAKTASDGTTSIPARYSRHPTSSGLYVIDKDVDAIGPYLFRVVVGYGVRSSRGSSEPFDPEQNPLEQPMQVEWDHEPIAEQIDIDLDGKPIVNSADERYDPPLQENVYDTVLTIRRNEPSYSPVVADQYINATNEDPWWVFAPGTVLCTRFRGSERRWADLVYYEVQYQFKFRFDGWLRRLPDMGRREYLGADDDGKPDYQPILTKTGQPVAEPVFLDGSGLRLSDADVRAGSVFMLEFRTKKIMPFGPLGL
jgi:hypothetical protein